MTKQVENLTGLYNNTEIFYHKAIELLKFKSAHNEFYEDSPVDYKVAISEYQAGLELMETLIQDDHFVDEASFKLIYNAINRYKEYLNNDYPMTVKLVTDYLDEVGEYAKLRFNS